MSIRASGIHVSLSGRPVLTGASIEAPSGRVVGLLGPNGAGKSTLIRALASLVPAQGTIEIDGASMPALSRDEQARRIAYLPQQRIIGWPLKVADVVALGRLPWGARSHAKDMSICRDAMALMDVAQLAERPANALSGGEQARVLAARAIAQDTPVLLADEPASGLDPAHQMSMMAAFRSLAAAGRTVLVSLHDLTLAARWCDTVTVLDAGRTVASGTPDTVMVDEVLGQVFGITARIERDAHGLIVTPVGLRPTTPRERR